jgi:hypothetical protein
MSKLKELSYENVERTYLGAMSDARKCEGSSLEKNLEALALATRALRELLDRREEYERHVGDFDPGEKAAAYDYLTQEEKFDLHLRRLKNLATLKAPKVIIAAELKVLAAVAWGVDYDQARATLAEIYGGKQS